MPDDIPKRAPVLDYATPQSPSRPPFASTGIHFVAGNGAATLLAALMILSGRSANYPITLACGGIFVVVIQWFFLTLPAWCRHVFWRRVLVERGTLQTVMAGLFCAAAVFGGPILIQKLHGPVLNAGYVISFFLFGLPIFASFVVFRRKGV